MRSPLSKADRDERIETFLTPRDWLRYAVGRFLSAGLAFGHGATTALDEAAFLILEGLKLPVDMLDPFLDAKLLRHERARLYDLVEARATTRKPAAYLLNRTYIKGVPFYVDERIIVPRSLIGELLMTAFAEDNALTGDPRRIASVLDLCTGGGSLAILAARVFPNARVDAVDCSAGALEVATAQRRGARALERVALKEGDLFAPVKGARYDLILANPPYVDAATIAEFPPEFAAEPRIAHAGGADGLDIVRRILSDAPAHLASDGMHRLRSRGRPGAARARFPAAAVHLARHRGDLRGGVSPARGRFRRNENATQKGRGAIAPGRRGSGAAEGLQNPRKEVKSPELTTIPFANRNISMTWRSIERPCHRQVGQRSVDVKQREARAERRAIP